MDVQALRNYAAKRAPDSQAAQLATRDIGPELSEAVRRFTIAALIDFGTAEPVWEVCIADLSRPVSLGEIAPLEQGYVDSINGQDSVCSPRNTYFVPLAPTRLAAAKPANRQALARWMRNAAAGLRVGLSPYLRAIADTDTTGSAIVLALDFHDTLSAPAAIERLRNLEALQSSNVDIGELANLAGGLQGVIFTLRLEDSLRGTIRLEFSRPPDALAKIGKPMLLEILARRGIHVADLRDWRPSVAGNSFLLQGSLTPSDVTRALSFLSTPSTVGSLGHEAMASSQSAGQSEQQLRAAASKRYFDSVTKAVASVRGFEPTTIGQIAFYNERIARKIDDLPLLNVDNDLLNYGQQVSNLIRGAGNTIRQANISAGGQRYGGTGYSLREAVSYSAQVTAGARAQGMSGHVQALTNVDQLTANVRRAMTERYQIEF